MFIRGVSTTGCDVVKSLAIGSLTNVDCLREEPHWKR